MQAAHDYQAVYDYLRLKHYQSATQDWNVPALKALADTAFTAGTREVVINSTSSEAGGSASGVVSFNRLVLLQAVMDLLREVAPDALPPEAPTGHVVSFGERYLSL